jgi:hypothetical protein
MDEQEMEAFVARVVSDSERTFRVEIDRALLETYAREAALDLWLSGSDITVSCANQALNQIREQISQRFARAAETDRAA